MSLLTEEHMRELLGNFRPLQVPSASSELPAPEPARPAGSLAVATGSVASLEAQIEHYFRTATDEQIEALLKKANFDFYNRIGADVLPPREAPQNHRICDTEK